MQSTGSPTRTSIQLTEPPTTARRDNPTASHHCHHCEEDPPWEDEGENDDEEDDDEPYGVESSDPADPTTDTTDSVPASATDDVDVDSVDDPNTHTTGSESTNDGVDGHTDGTTTDTLDPDTPSDEVDVFSEGEPTFEGSSGAGGGDPSDAPTFGDTPSEEEDPGEGGSQHEAIASTPAEPVNDEISSPKILKADPPTTYRLLDTPRVLPVAQTTTTTTSSGASGPSHSPTSNETIRTSTSSDEVPQSSLTSTPQASLPPSTLSPKLPSISTNPTTDAFPSAAPASTSSPSARSITPGIIAGTAIAVSVVFLAIIIALVFLVRRLRRNQTIPRPYTRRSTIHVTHVSTSRGSRNSKLWGLLSADEFMGITDRHLLLDHDDASVSNIAVCDLEIEGASRVSFEEFGYSKPPSYAS